MKKSIFYSIMLIDYIITIIYLIRHTDTTGVILILIFVSLVTYSAKKSLENEDKDED